MDPKKKKKRKGVPFFFRLRIARFITGKGKKKKRDDELYRYLQIHQGRHHAQRKKKMQKRWFDNRKIKKIK